MEPSQQQTYLALFQQYLQALQKWAQSWNHEGPLWVTFFSEEGLHSFVRHGVWTESIMGMIIPVPQRLRAGLLKRMLQMTNKGVYLPLILNPNCFSVAPQLVCDSYSERLLLANYANMENTCVLAVCEPSIFSIVRRFLDYLPDSDMV